MRFLTRSQTKSKGKSDKCKFITPWHPSNPIVSTNIARPITKTLFSIKIESNQSSGIRSPADWK